MEPLEGTLPAAGMQCHIPGAGSGSGMSMPAPLPPPTGMPPSGRIPLRDGETWTFDMAQSDGAAQARRGRVNISGLAKVRLVLCPQR